MPYIPAFDRRVIVMPMRPGAEAYICSNLDAAIRSLTRHSGLLTDTGGSFVYTSPFTYDPFNEDRAFWNGYSFYTGDWRHIAPETVVARAKELHLEWLNRPIRSYRFRGPYVYRQGPVPGTRKRRGWGHWLRHPSTLQEMRQSDADANDEELKDLKVRVRGRRSRAALPTVWDDIIASDTGNHNWKRHRRHQWRGH